jgi:hypothetical protein
VSAAIQPPTGLRADFALRTLAAVADRAKAVTWNAERLEHVDGSFRPARSESEIIGGGPAFVAVSLYNDLQARELLQQRRKDRGVRPKRIEAGGRDVGAVVVEIRVDQ